MKKAKNRTSLTIAVMSMIAIVLIGFYFYWNYRTKPVEEASLENMTKAQKLITKDLELYYPETPREVVKLFGNMINALYDNVSDEDLEPLALKVRELYDEEFLAANPEEAYLTNLKADLAEWKKNKRRIATNFIVKKEDEQQSVMEGVNYSINYISFTIQEEGKFTETWKVMLRQDSKKKWKILGWQVVPND
jgi:hypothetical protein